MQISRVLLLLLLLVFLLSLLKNKGVADPGGPPVKVERVRVMGKVGEKNIPAFPPMRNLGSNLHG